MTEGEVVPQNGCLMNEAFDVSISIDGTFDLCDAFPLFVCACLAWRFNPYVALSRGQTGL